MSNEEQVVGSGVTLAWHFLAMNDAGVPLLRDGTPAPTDGSWLHVAPPLEMCARGLHASEQLFDALRYAPGSIICRVEMAGEILRGGDKVCAQHRRILWWVDASRVLRLWACDVAEQALRECGVDDARSWHAVAVARRHAYGDATRTELAAARDAAGDVWAARDAAKDAARSAAWDAAWAAWAARAARAAVDATDAGDAVSAASRAASRAAVSAAASAAAATSADRAARAAARAAAGAAYTTAQNRDLTERVLTRARELGLTTEVPS